MTEVLEGVRVVELSTVITAPLAGMMLADLGAEVIKVEHPDAEIRSEFPRRALQPEFRRLQPRQAQHRARSAQRRGPAILLKLLARADVLLENYRARHHGAARPGGRRAQGRQCPADPLLDHRLRRDRALQRAAGLRQRGAGAERDPSLQLDPDASAVERADDRRQCHRHVRLLRHPRRAVRARTDRQGPPGRGQHAGGRRSPSSPIHSRTTPVPELPTIR